MLTHDQLYDALHYCPETGIFTNLGRKGAGAGKVAGTPNSGGYLQIQVNGKRYVAQRLAFLYMTGAWPPAFVDHINGDRADNRWCNLRPATTSENHRNRKYGGSTSGHKNVYWTHGGRRGGKGWLVKVISNGKTHSKFFKSLEEAVACSEELRTKYHGDFARHM